MKAFGPQNREEQRITIFSNPASGWIGILSLFISVGSLSLSGEGGGHIAMVSVLVMFVTMGIYEYFLCRASQVGETHKPPDIRGVFLFRLAGFFLLGAVAGSVFLLYSMLAPDFYAPAVRVLVEYGWLLGACWAIVILAETFSGGGGEESAEHWLGKSLVSGEFRDCPTDRMTDCVLTWGLRALFLPLMFVLLCRYIEIAKGGVMGLSSEETFRNFTNVCLMILAAFSCVGYAFPTSLTGGEVRSVDKAPASWLVTTVCCQPFWGALCVFYANDYGRWVEALPTEDPWRISYGVMASATCAFMVWAAAGFGTRYTLLTERGIVVSGPYKFFRHPSYVAEVLFLLLLAGPFHADSPVDFLRKTVLFCGVAGLYFLRAKAEERHLDEARSGYSLYRRFVRRNQTKVVNRISELFSTSDR